MFGSTNPIGQSSSSPLGFQSVFGQTNASSSGPFVPKPFGSTTPLGSKTSSLFGGALTGVVGASSLSSTTTFGGSSLPAFGSSVPAFGSSSTSAFGNSSSSFAGLSTFGQKPAFGEFAAYARMSPFGGAGQPSQTAFGSSIFDSSTHFGASSQPTLGSTSTPVFGSASTAAFGSTSAPTFGATSAPAFGSTSSPTFGHTWNAVGVSSPAFGAGEGFDASSTPLFHCSAIPVFGTSSTPAFGASSTPSFSFGSTIGKSTSAFGSSPFGSTFSSVAGQSYPFGSQTTSSAFGSTGIENSGSGGHRGGSRVIYYAPMTEEDGGTSKLESISAMPIYKDKSHEELRWEEYQIGDKGSQMTSSAFGSTSTSTFGFLCMRCILVFFDLFSTFRGQRSLFGSQTTSLASGGTGVGHSCFGRQKGGSRVVSYTPTAEVDVDTSGRSAKLESISAMPIYKDKSHEELKWEDYQIGDKGGPLSFAQSTGLVGFNSTTPQINTFAPSPAFGQWAANAFSTLTPSNPLAIMTSAFTTGFGTSSTPAFS
ncbi:nuclear pore complex protein NUP98B-like [Neltuma alba]|uniref:nuclear pore complex protein NUP98B-like n=1 Tax=Neltuma alba TaxID=207710 RepID=UPI0010A46446|nr:nuclear pore complex protein NUP98B-like [Prosopis alba]